MRKKWLKIALTSILAVGALVPVASAANYKFHFDVTTNFLTGRAYTNYAWKFTDKENQVVKITSIDSNWTAGVRMENSEGAKRSSNLYTKKAGNYTLTNNGAKASYKYRLKIWKEKGGKFDRFTMKGKWNPDTY